MYLEDAYWKLDSFMQSKYNIPTPHHIFYVLNSHTNEFSHQ